MSKLFIFFKKDDTDISAHGIAMCLETETRLDDILLQTRVDETCL